MTESRAYRQVSWSIEADVLDQVQARVPRGQQSAYVTRALRRQLERDGLEELIGELVNENGPLNEDEVYRYTDELR